MKNEEFEMKNYLFVLFQASCNKGNRLPFFLYSIVIKGNEHN